MKPQEPSRESQTAVLTKTDQEDAEEDAIRRRAALIAAVRARQALVFEDGGVDSIGGSSRSPGDHGDSSSSSSSSHPAPRRIDKLFFLPRPKVPSSPSSAADEDDSVLQWKIRQAKSEENLEISSSKSDWAVPTPDFFLDEEDEAPLVLREMNRLKEARKEVLRKRAEERDREAEDGPDKVPVVEPSQPVLIDERLSDPYAKVKNATKLVFKPRKTRKDEESD